MEINKEEILAYLGYHGQARDKELEALLDSAITEVQILAEPRHVFEVYDVIMEDEGVRVQGSALVLVGRDIRAHLRCSCQVVLMAVTLGVGIERRIQQLQYQNMAQAVILDACATTAIEGVCDVVEAEIRAQHVPLGFHLTDRYSPGYGDFPLEIQSQLLHLLQAPAKIGLMSTQHHILVPRKSVTAVLGIGQQWSPKKAKCDGCKYEHCNYRREAH